MATPLQQIQLLVAEGFKREITVKEKRPGLFQVYAPFYYPDGDMVEVFVHSLGDGSFEITDLGLGLMKLSYEFELNTQNKRKVLNEILGNYQITESKGVLSIKSSEESLFAYLLHFINVLIKVSDISYLKRETVQSLFYEYFNGFVFDKLKEFQPQRDYSPTFDRDKLYPSPYVILVPGKQPLSIFPISNDKKCDEVTITCLNYEKHDYKAQKIAVFESQEDIGRRTLSKLTDVVDKQFSSLDANQDRIFDYIREAVA
jgi:hypothetical protein